jgi:hypothetical protein
MTGDKRGKDFMVKKLMYNIYVPFEKISIH